MDTQQAPGPATSEWSGHLLSGTPAARAELAAAIRPAASAAGVVVVDDGSTTGDAALVVAEAAAELDGAMRDRIAALPADRPVLLAFTGIDRHRHWRRVLAADVAWLATAGRPVEVFAVATGWFRQALASGDHALAVTSGVPALAARIGTLPQIASGEEARAVAREVLDVLAGPDALPPAPAPAGGGPVRPRPGRTGWQQVLGDGVAAAASDVDYDLRVRARAVLADAEQLIDAGDPARDHAGLDAWVRERLVYEAHRTCGLLAERVRQLTSSLSAHLDLPAPAALHPPAPPPLPDPFAALPRRSGPVKNARPLAARGRTLLASAYLPHWMLVAGALTAAAALGCAALAGERSRGLERRRTGAKADTRHCTDGFLLAVGKFTRDALRDAQQQLRQECTARVAPSGARSTGGDGAVRHLAAAG
jgi:hypothetical protein